MSSKDYYPSGSFDDPNAPYNQHDQDDMVFNVSTTFTLQKDVQISSSDFTIYKYDDDYDSEKIPDVIDTSGIVWFDEFHKNHLSVDVLLREFKRMLFNQIDVVKQKYNNIKDISPEDRKLIDRYKYLLDECDGWVLEDFDFEEIK